MTTRALLIVVALGACKKEAAAPEPDPPKVAQPKPPPADAPKPLPSGPYVIHYNCFHSDMPFGKGSQSRNFTYDLGAKTVTTEASETTGEEQDRPPAPPGAKADARPAPVVAQLAPAHVAKLEAAAIAVLRGGPFQPEYPVPEGTPCTLSIANAGGELFTIEKAYAKNPDAVSALVAAFSP